MRERPILFSAPMVRAILAGTKSQTRRVVKPQPDFAQVHEWNGKTIRDCEARAWCWKGHDFGDGDPCNATPGPEMAALCPYGVPGDRLWVREAFAYSVKDPDSFKNDEYTEEQYDAVYRADAEGQGEWTHYDENGKQTRISPPWRPSIHMPRWASRITLEVTGVRVERLHDITDADAEAEGATVDEMHGHLDEVAICKAAKALRCSYEDSRAWFGALWMEINGEDSLAANPWVWVVEFKRVEAQERAA